MSVQALETTKLTVDGIALLYYARHGHSVWNHEMGTFGGGDAEMYADSPLHRDGVEDAVNLARAAAQKAGVYGKLRQIADRALPGNHAEVAAWTTLFQKAQAAAKNIFNEDDPPARAFNMDQAEALELLTKTPITGSPLFRARDTAFIGFAVARVLLVVTDEADNGNSALSNWPTADNNGPQTAADKAEALLGRVGPFILWGWQETDQHNDCIATLGEDDGRTINELRGGAGGGVPKTVADIRAARTAVYADAGKAELREFADACADMAVVRETPVHGKANLLSQAWPGGNPHISSGSHSYKLARLATTVIAKPAERSYLPVRGYLVTADPKPESTVNTLTGLVNGALKVVKKPIQYTRGVKGIGANTRLTDLKDGMRQLYDIALATDTKQVVIGAHSASSGTPSRRSAYTSSPSSRLRATSSTSCTAI